MLYFGSADTAPTGRKTFVLWRPPIVGEWYSPPSPKEGAGAAGKTPKGWGRTRRGFFDCNGRGKKAGARTRSEASFLSGGISQGAAEVGDEDGADGGVADSGVVGRISSGKGKGKGKGKGGQKMPIAVGSRRGGRLRTPKTSSNGEDKRGEKGGNVSMPTTSEMEAKATKEEGRGLSASVAAAAAERGRKDCGSSSPAQLSRLQPGIQAGCSPSAGKTSTVVGGDNNNFDGVGAAADVVSEMGTVSRASTTLKTTGDAARAGGAPVISTPRLQRWRKGPTDNHYNREYIKLMGAELPRPLRRAAREGADGDSVGCSSSFHGGAPAEAREPAVVGESPTGDVAAVTLQAVGVGGGYVATSAAAAASLEGSIMDDAAEATALAQAGDPNSTGERMRVEPAMSGVSEGKVSGSGGGGGDGVEDGPRWEDGKRRSPICETANVLTALVKQRVRTLAFCRTRKLTELTLRYGRQVCLEGLYVP